MKHFLRGLGWLFITLAGTAALAQNGSFSGKVSQLSDQQIIQLWQQAQKSGMSESDAVRLLVQKGMSPTEVNAFKKRLVQLQAGSKSRFSTNSIIKDTSNFMRDSTWIFETPQLKKNSPYYGFDFFNSPEMSFEPNFNVATPASYVLGANDELTLSLSGLNELTNTAVISREGNYELPHAGFVNLNGLTIDQATQQIKNRLRVPYPGLASGRTRLYLSLGNVRGIRISVIGEAEKPGNYTVTALASFFNVLYLSGGPSQNGSLRKIELIRDNKVLQTVDFYEFLQKGTLPNIRLQDQDVIRFPVYEKRVMLAGEVKRPAIYELLGKETLADLISYGGGLGDHALKDAVKLVQLGDKERKVRDVADADFAYFLPRNGDSVQVEKILSRFSNRVVISGAVYHPGNYELSQDLTLTQLIRKADGLREDAFRNRGYIVRFRDNGALRELVSFDLNQIQSGKSNDIALIREDSVYIPARDSIRDVLSVTVGGNVRNPGSFEFRQGISVEDAIVMAGGFTADAATHKVEISRLEKNKSDTLANQLLSLLKVDVDSTLQQSSHTLLQPLDYVFVPKLLNYHTLGNVKLRGEVLYSGDYALERRDETVQELLLRAGGITPYASMANVQVYRNHLRVGTNLFEAGNRSNEKFLLLPDDSIYVPRNVPFVEVQGAVFTPQILSYGSGRMLSYIADAGGVTDKGNLRKAYVAYSNGINKKIRHFLFFRHYPRVMPGSKIIVPERLEGEKRGLSVIEISALTGSFTALISLIAVLRK